MKFIYLPHHVIHDNSKGHLKTLKSYVVGNRGLLLVAIIGILFFSGCSSSRHVSSNIEAEKEAAFFARYSKAFGFELSGDENKSLISEVGSWLETPYLYGGVSRNGADCSGFALSVYKQVYSYDLPRTVKDMASHSRRVRKSRLKEGNLVFFRTKRRKVSHVGIYLGQGYFIHVSSSRGVIVNHLDQPYYKRTFAFGGKVKL